MNKKYLVDKEMSEWIKTIKAKSARFYKLPKIHKKDKPGIPILSSISCFTIKLSKYVDYHIQSLPNEIKSYIRVSTDFLKNQWPCPKIQF